VTQGKQDVDLPESVDREALLASGACVEFHLLKKGGREGGREGGV